MFQDLQSCSFSLSLQDVALQILGRAQRRDHRAAPGAVQTALLRQLHHVLLQDTPTGGVRAAGLEENPSRRRKPNLVVHGDVHVDVVPGRGEQRTALQLQLLQSSCSF